ncbi:MAG: 30S ribosomal protein S20 [Salinisphaera sp.]|nr:30S ribosomal protein S20 [Salinisphaera sp.]
MANSPQARKRARQSVDRRKHNMAQRSLIRTQIKKVRKAIAAGDADTAQAAYQQAMPVLDAMVGKGRVHGNKAARHKSRLNAQIKALRA